MLLEDQGVVQVAEAKPSADCPFLVSVVVL